MAKAGQGRVHPGKRRADPMMTKNGRPRLKPLNITQLTTMLEKTQLKKIKRKIINRIELLTARKTNENKTSKQQDATS